MDGLLGGGGANGYVSPLSNYWGPGPPCPPPLPTPMFCASSTLPVHPPIRCLYDLAMLVTMPPLLPRLMTSKGASTTLPLRQRIWSYASSAPTTMQMRSYYDLRASEAALMLHLCCALRPLLCKPAGSRASAAVAEHQPSNKAYNTCVIIPTWQS